MGIVSNPLFDYLLFLAVPKIRLKAEPSEKEGSQPLPCLSDSCEEAVVHHHGDIRLVAAVVRDEPASG